VGGCDDAARQLNRLHYYLHYHNNHHNNIPPSPNKNDVLSVKGKSGSTVMRHSVTVGHARPPAFRTSTSTVRSQYDYPYFRAGRMTSISHDINTRKVRGAAPRCSSTANSTEKFIVSRCGAGTTLPSVLHRRFTTAEGDALGTAVMMAATAAAISRGVIRGRSRSASFTCTISTTAK